MSRIATLIFGFALAKVTETGLPAWVSRKFFPSTEERQHEHLRAMQ